MLPLEECRHRGRETLNWKIINIITQRILESLPPVLEVLEGVGPVETAVDGGDKL